MCWLRRLDASIAITTCLIRNRAYCSTTMTNEVIRRSTTHVSFNNLCQLGAPYEVVRWQTSPQQVYTIDLSITSHKIRKWEFDKKKNQKQTRECRTNLNSPNTIRFYSEAHFRSCTILFFHYERYSYSHMCICIICQTQLIFDEIH